MSFSRFHPLVQQWFTTTLGGPTAAQTRGWESIGDGGHTLIAAPTGSGKTLAAFLAAIDELTREGLESPLPDEVRVIYVSPLKALSADIHKNLAEPRRGIRRLAADAGLQVPHITAAVRTGDTSSAAGRNRVVYRDGVPLAVREGDFIRELAPIDPAVAAEVSRALSRRPRTGTPPVRV